MLRHVTGLRGGSAPGCDGVPASVLKNNFYLFSKPLLHIVNLSISNGIFPDIFKIAKIFPLYKSNDYTDRNNFRPIALLSVFSKVLEKVVKEQFTRYLQCNSVLADCQFGFREDKNISDVLFEVNREINAAFSSNMKSMLIFLDLKKAFDSVDRKKLLLKLEAIGVNGNALSWFRTFLTNRRQVVSICGVNSEELPVDYGVIQGSTLGPVLFLVYINNISKLNIDSKLFLFADDALLFVKAQQWAEVRLKALSDIMTLKTWMDQNLLSLNISKTKFLPLSLKPNSDYSLQDLVIHSCGNYLNNICTCESIEKVSSFKYLGVIFDNRMNWSCHFVFLKNKLRKFIFVFRQINDILNKNEIKLMYFAYVQSLLSFGILAWGAAYSTYIEPINIIQKAILKAGFKKCKRYPTDSLFLETGVLSIRKLFIKHLLIFMYKNLHVLFTETSHSYNTRYARNTGINVMLLSKTFSTTNTFYVSQILYRNLCKYYPQIVLFDAPSVPVFKRRVGEWLSLISPLEAEDIIAAEYRRS